MGMWSGSASATGRGSWAKWNTPFSSGPKLPRILPLPALIDQNRENRIWKIPIQNIPVQKNQNRKLPVRIFSI